MKTLFTILLLAPMLAFSQTIHYFTGDTINCFVPACGCEKTYQETILPPWNGSIGFDQAAPGSNRSFILMRGNEVLLDTCITTPGTGIPTQVYWSSNDTIKVFFCGPDSTALGVWHFSGSGNPALGSPLVNIDTLCQAPLPLIIVLPITIDTILIGSYDLQGRPCKGNGPCIDVYQTGTTYFTRKWWDVYKK